MHTAFLGNTPVAPGNLVAPFSSHAPDQQQLQAVAAQQQLQQQALIQQPTMPMQPAYYGSLPAASQHFMDPFSAHTHASQQAAFGGMMAMLGGFMSIMGTAIGIPQPMGHAGFNSAAQQQQQQPVAVIPQQLAGTGVQYSHNTQQPQMPGCRGQYASN